MSARGKADVKKVTFVSWTQPTEVKLIFIGWRVIKVKGLNPSCSLTPNLALTLAHLVQIYHRRPCTTPSPPQPPPLQQVRTRLPPLHAASASTSTRRCLNLHLCSRSGSGLHLYPPPPLPTASASTYARYRLSLHLCSKSDLSYRTLCVCVCARAPIPIPLPLSLSLSLSLLIELLNFN
jgi:hypothetical protein